MGKALGLEQTHVTRITNEIIGQNLQEGGENIEALRREKIAEN